MAFTSLQFDYIETALVMAALAKWHIIIIPSPLSTGGIAPSGTAIKKFRGATEITSGEPCGRSVSAPRDRSALLRARSSQ